MIKYDVLYHNKLGKVIKRQDESMKICIIATHYLPHIGGLELATYHLARELTSLGHEVHIITPQNSVSTDNDSDKIIIHRLPIQR